MRTVANIDTWSKIKKTNRMDFNKNLKEEEINKTKPIKCPECNKKVIDVHNYKGGDKLFIHKRTRALIGYHINGCYINKPTKEVNNE